MKKIFLILFSPILIFSIFLIYAIQPSVDEKEFPLHHVIHFQENVIPVPKPTLTLATYNIGYASGEKNNKGAILTKEEVLYNLDKLALAIQKMNPDVIGLQEVDFKSYRSFDINQLLYLNQKLGYPFAAYVVTWNKKYVAWPYWPLALHFRSVVSGQAVLSRYPIEQQELLHFEKPQDNAFWYNWFYLDRIAQKLTLTDGDQKIIAWNVHLEAFKQKTRNEQARILANAIRDLGKGVSQFVLGDFNSVSAYSENLKLEKILKMEEDGEALKIILNTSQLHNAEPLEPVFTMPSWEAIKKIDHILVDDFFTFLEGDNLQLTASDHLPYWASFKKADFSTDGLEIPSRDK
ncbi:MAG: hypothetical protein A3G32_06245 [Deltaproteobacteria bacterium RIFCSPLOWO2_12_FULL_40_28]|nr:MAG: hypothetical protein A3C45_02340 [Deltaproteobacteria bacterium RIFCSPHIGHO2_02_FULL_40_28]OGQ19055.1 MAG: hypothetical protein A3E27_05430 [Deltaproteobacteria bacterium RIFCSPHIGHO2_12_FULL_40_32]OGQ40227.1 MAG: hypothetical protein A3I69_00870 [Deltaproteobacteria bacterium RIFCSPLOWO2_02_FULL_40_36]OGQ53498.1 MAG: hypothetical protein A3G32_06245 [Deltaproteobacteria bacterium RIFCSPLOWO2_12_FULL_40_28]